MRHSSCWRWSAVHGGLVRRCKSVSLLYSSAVSVATDQASPLLCIPLVLLATAKGDALNPLINGLFKEFRRAQELESFKDSDAFELFAASLILSDEMLAQEQMTDLLLDADVLGIDVAVLEINGQLAWDIEDVVELCATSKIDVSVHFIQAKQSASISSAEILSFGDAVTRFLNNEKFEAYPRLKALAQALRAVFDDYAVNLKTSPSVFLYYVTTAPKTATVDPNVVSRAEAVRDDIAQLGFIGDVVIRILGTDDLHEAWVRKNHANEVEIQFEKQVNLPKMPGIDQAILGVISVLELLKLIKDDLGLRDERVFYDNVRGFKGVDNPVNRQIIATLESPERSLLPVLNNGVTVVAGSYTPKPGDAVAISSYQIVNGCQTSHCLYLSQEVLANEIAEVYVPLRLVITGDEDVATKIIRATNSQTEVQENDLLALSKFQKKLEDFYRLDDADVKLTYERRSGQFYEQDVTKTRVLTIRDQMRAVSAVFLDLPHLASRYTDRLYGEVGIAIFREDHKLLPYVAGAFAAYRLENAFRAGLDPRYKPARYHLLTAFKYQILGEKSAALESSKIEMQSGRLITALKSPDQVDLFRAAAEAVVGAAGGELPSPDRLKRQQFTTELVSALAASFAKS